MTVRRLGGYAARSMDRGQAQDALLVLTTCDSAARARALAEHLVDRHLAACVNTLDAVQSSYRWQGRIEHAAELLLLVKTTRERYDAVEAAIREHSSYELPEVIAVPIARGFDRYIDWIRAATAAEGNSDSAPSNDESP